MSKFHVALKAVLPEGELYWVSNVNATNETDAMKKAEKLFLSQLDRPFNWQFTEADIEII